jgi:replicative DNA helicase
MTANLANARNVDVERAVLSVLLDGRHKPAAGVLLELCPTADHFAERDNHLMARVILRMAAAGERIDAQAVMAALMRLRFADVLEGKQDAMRQAEGISMGDSLYAAVRKGFDACVSAFGPVAGFRANCQILAEYHAQRRLLVTLGKALEDASAVGGSSRVAAIGDALVNDVARMLGKQVASQTMAGAMDEALAAHDAARTQGEPKVASWGIQGLDRMVPLKGGRLVVLAASPGGGKTSLALQAVTASAQALGPDAVGVVSLEMRGEQLAQTLLARAIGVAQKAIENGWLSAEQRDAATLVRADWQAAGVALKEHGGDRCTIRDVLGWIRHRSLRSEGRLGLVVIDYLGLIDGPKPDSKEYDTLREATRALKTIANQLRICVLLLAQLNREGRKPVRNTRGGTDGNPEPRLEDLRGSGSIEQDADAVVFLWPPAKVKNSDLPVTIIAAKNRQGVMGQTLDCIFERARGQVFREAILAEPVTEADSKRAHHNHPPDASEDKYADEQGGIAQEQQA